MPRNHEIFFDEINDRSSAQTFAKASMEDFPGFQKKGIFLLIVA